jgi:hypothetical protein
MGRTSNVPKPISKTTKPVRRRSRAAAPGLPYEDSLIESLKNRKEAAACLEAAIEDGEYCRQSIHHDALPLMVTYRYQ